jgi:hypothetical protein
MSYKLPYCIQHMKQSIYVRLFRPVTKVLIFSINKIDVIFEHPVAFIYTPLHSILH